MKKKRTELLFFEICIKMVTKLPFWKCYLFRVVCCVVCAWRWWESISNWQQAVAAPNETWYLFGIYKDKSLYVQVHASHIANEPSSHTYTYYRCMLISDLKKFMIRNYCVNFPFDFHFNRPSKTREIGAHRIFGGVCGGYNFRFHYHCTLYIQFIVISIQVPMSHQYEFAIQKSFQKWVFFSSSFVCVSHLLKHWSEYLHDSSLRLEMFWLHSVSFRYVSFPPSRRSVIRVVQWTTLKESTLCIVYLSKISIRSLSVLYMCVYVLGCWLTADSIGFYFSTTNNNKSCCAYFSLHCSTSRS